MRKKHKKFRDTVTDSGIMNEQKEFLDFKEFQVFSENRFFMYILLNDFKFFKKNS